MKFKNPVNNYVEDASTPGLWCLLFGFFYFASKSVWNHAIIGLILAMLTFFLSWLIYPVFAEEIIRNSYLRRGWIEVIDEPDEVISEDRTTETFLVLIFLAVVIVGGGIYWKMY